MASWEVTGFQIQSHTSELKPDSVNADGKMQAPVYVFIKANVKGADDHYRLTEEELNKIELIEFDGANHQLSDGWSYSDKEGPSVPSARVATQLNVSGPDNIGDSYQSKCFWVSSTNAEDKNINARITQPDGKIVTTETSTKVSFATVAGTTTTIVEVVPEVTICRPAFFSKPVETEVMIKGTDHCEGSA
ncbi:hypothetical protein BDW75DRAFT_225700 [Aspergillus navahoensis]